MSKRVADISIETRQAAGVKRCYGIVGVHIDHRDNHRLFEMTRGDSIR
jgi:hypothetical protein